MEQSPYGSRRLEEQELHLREWTMRAQISRENTRSRRFSGSHIRSFRDSFRSSVTISSTASSPGYAFKEEIDPSTYSFTTALKALQARSGCYNSWDCYSPDGFALHSKWNEAEKYICNPLSGEVPMECLSAKTLSGRSFRNLTNRITMSAPLVYNPSHSRQIHAKSTAVATQDDITHFPIKEDKMEGMTRDVGTQSTPHDLSSSSPSPTSKPSIIERSLKRCEAEAEDSPHCNQNSKTEDQNQAKETKEKEETTKVDSIGKVERKQKGDEQTRSCISIISCRQGGCLSWMRKRQREKHKPRKKSSFLPSLKGC